jgi:tetratricopeptide (TPR) repeat protein
VTPRVRIAALTAVVAGAAAAVTVAGTVLQSRDGQAAAEPERPRGVPPLVLDLGVRADPEAQELRRAASLYDRGRLGEALGIFERYPSSLDAEVGAALARWPRGSVARLEGLAWVNPRSALVHLNLGFALFWAGRREDALAEWRKARQVDPDSPAAVRADDLLYPGFARGLPTFVPSFEAPARLASLRADRHFAELERAARTSDYRAKLLYGAALQRLGHARSAEREFAAAAALAPDVVETQVAAAVGRFDKARPARAFSRLGPLTSRYPDDPSVRFHLGLLLLWSGELEEAKRQLTIARGGEGKLAREAGRLLERLAK